ncbi:MAG: beta-N-acetylhexosaminidase [Clostridia bacterium]|nr:beta-N-acetylhexosaminidase [Clostridia bacterium]
MSVALALTMLISMNCIPYAASDAAAWTPAAGTEILVADTPTAASARIAPEPTEYRVSLDDQVKLFASELAAVEGKTTERKIKFGPRADAGTNDIILILDSALTSIPAQGYTVALSGSQIVVSASDDDGLFFGCRYIIQQMKLNSKNVTAGVADNPDVLERALSLDIGRKYYSANWIKEIIKEMSWSNMNVLALHFSEEMGLGIQSTKFTWLNGRDGDLCVGASVPSDNTQLTQAEIAEIIEFAKLYHVEILPSSDSPGHMNYIVKKFNAKAASDAFSFTYDGISYSVAKNTDIGNYFHYNGQTAIVQGSRNTSYSRGIDISNAVAAAFTKSLLKEYADLFRSHGCTKIDIGGDELLGWGTSLSSTVPKWQQLDHWRTYAHNRAQSEGNPDYNKAVAYDAFIYYMNDMYDLVKSWGYTSVRMWNDDALRSDDTGWQQVVTLKSGLEILYWAPTANGSRNNIRTYLDAGHKVYNYLNYYNYYVLGSNYAVGSNNLYKGATQQKIYEEWNAFRFDTEGAALGEGKNTAAGNTNVLGTAFCIWCDTPNTETESTVKANVIPLLRAVGAKAWDYEANNKVSYSEFKSNVEIFGNYTDLGSVTV